MKLNAVVFHNFQSRFGHFTHFQKPLQGQFGFDYFICTLRKTNFIDVVFCFFEVSSFFQINQYFFPNGKTILTNVKFSLFAHGSIVIKNIDGFEFVFHSQFIVMNVVGRSDFQSSRSKFPVNIFILNNRNCTVYQWDNYFFPMKGNKSFVFGMYTNGGIAKNGFGTGGCNRNKIVFALNLIFQIVEFRL